MDRTQEFQKHTDRVLKSAVSGTRHLTPQATATETSSLNVLAHNVSCKFTGLHERVAQVRSLIEQRNAFSQSSSRPLEICNGIARDLEQANMDIEQLCATSRAEAGDNAQLLQHHNGIISILRSRLQEVTSELQAVITRCSELSEKTNARRAMYAFSEKVVRPSTGDFNSRMGGRGNGGVNGFAPFVATDADIELIERGIGSSQSGDVVGRSSDSNQQQDMRYINLSESRLSAAQSIERKIGEIASTFSRMAHSVQAQEEMVMRIDQFVDSAYDSVIHGQSQLRKHLNRIQGHRGMILKLFAAVFIIFLILAATR